MDRHTNCCVLKWRKFLRKCSCKKLEKKTESWEIVRLKILVFNWGFSDNGKKGKEFEGTCLLGGCRNRWNSHRMNIEIIRMSSIVLSSACHAVPHTISISSHFPTNGCYSGKTPPRLCFGFLHGKTWIIYCRQFPIISSWAREWEELCKTTKLIRNERGKPTCWQQFFLANFSPS